MKLEVIEVEEPGPGINDLEDKDRHAPVPPVQPAQAHWFARNCSAMVPDIVVFVTPKW